MLLSGIMRGMKNFLLISLTLLSLPAFADCETYTRFGVATEICWIPDYKGYFAKKCLSHCDARKFLDKHHKRPAKIDRMGGKNPDSQYCLASGFSVVVMRDAKLNQQSFCEFSDKSVVDTNAFARSLR